MEKYDLLERVSAMIIHSNLFTCYWDELYLLHATFLIELLYKNGSYLSDNIIDTTERENEIPEVRRSRRQRIENDLCPDIMSFSGNKIVEKSHG